MPPSFLCLNKQSWGLTGRSRRSEIKYLEPTAVSSTPQVPAIKLMRTEATGSALPTGAGSVMRVVKRGRGGSRGNGAGFRSPAGSRCRRARHGRERAG